VQGERTERGKDSEVSIRGFRWPELERECLVAAAKERILTTPAYPGYRILFAAVADYSKRSNC